MFFGLFSDPTFEENWGLSKMFVFLSWLVSDPTFEEKFRLVRIFKKNYSKNFISGENADSRFFFVLLQIFEFSMLPCSFGDISTLRISFFFLEKLKIERLSNLDKFCETSLIDIKAIKMRLFWNKFLFLHLAYDCCRIFFLLGVNAGLM